jgi:hypothetical protein
MDNLQKVIIRLDSNEWHGYATETVWAKLIEKNKYILKSIPFYARDISYNDIFITNIIENNVYFVNIFKRNGHSTYRLFLTDKEKLNEFTLYWTPLEMIGCSYERATNSLYAIDVPANTDVHIAYEYLVKGENVGLWSFEEGHCGHSIG